MAVGLARLGSPVWLLTEIGDDAFGHILRDHFDSNGVNLPSPSESSTPDVHAEARIDPTGRRPTSSTCAGTRPGTDRPSRRRADTRTPARSAHCFRPAASKVPGWLESARASGTVSYDPTSGRR